jgi:hypothetical protein
MTELRPGFQEITSGWLLFDDFYDLTDRIERLASWTRTVGGLNADERATVTLMIERQIALGGEIYDDGAAPDDDPPTLGPCCICEAETGARTIVMLPVKGVIPGHGWGCVVCRLPFDGASAVVCGDCAEGLASGTKPLRFACRGYPATEGRVPIDDLTEPHKHDESVEH